MPETSQAASRRLMFALGGLALLLAVGGAVSFVSYARRHTPNPALIAVAPFDIFTPGGEGGLDRWRVGLAQALTERLSVPPLATVPQAVVAGTWRSAPQPEIAALELARRTGAAVAIYGRVDPIAVSGGGASAQGPDSVRVSLIAVDAFSSRVVFGVLVRWPAADPAGLAAQLAEHVRHNHPVSRPAP